MSMSERSAVTDDLKREGYSKEDEFIYRREREIEEMKRALEERRRAPKRQPEAMPPQKPKSFFRATWEVIARKLGRGDPNWRP